MALLLGCGENPKLGGYAEVLVVHRKMPLTINIALSEKVSEFSAFVRIQ
jgi:hypothetical protein